MFSARASLISRRHRYCLLPLLLVLSVLMIAGCRKKDNPKPLPTDPEPGEWSLVLPGPLVMFRDTVSGHVPSDTIIVRLYGPDGNLRGGVNIQSQASVSVGRVRANVTSWSDTTTHWWGTDEALVYWGDGGTEGHETVTSYAVVDSDTVTASLSFKVLNPY